MRPSLKPEVKVGPKEDPMKTKTIVTAAALALGASLPGWARQVPVGPGVPIASVQVAYEVGTKGLLKTAAIPGSHVTLGAWYRYCPVLANVPLNPKHEAVVALSNGKRIVLSCATLKGAVEADLKRYEPYMF